MIDFMKIMNGLLKSIVSVVMLLVFYMQFANAESMRRMDFVGSYVPNMTQKMCNSANSPFAGKYKGDQKNCSAELMGFAKGCSEQVVPNTIENGRVMESIVVMSQCLMANYQGGEALKIFNQQTSAVFSIDRRVWLRNLRPVMQKSMCEQKDADFGKVYKGEDCQADVMSLFDQCVMRVPNVDIPETINGFADADHHAQVVPACITAHHVGGETLTSFLSIGAN